MSERIKPVDAIPGPIGDELPEAPNNNGRAEKPSPDRAAERAVETAFQKHEEELKKELKRLKK